MLLIGHCSNPGCHRPYVGDNYNEVITLREMRDGQLNYFVISICGKCLASANNIIVSNSLRDAVEYEIIQNNASIVLTKAQKQEFQMKESNYRFINWGRNREELDDKLKA